MKNPTSDLTASHDQSGCPACEAYAAGNAGLAAAPAAPGCLLWICPLCGRAWPRYAAGDRGRLASSLCGRLNQRRRVDVSST